jgi:hypothetical protein
MKKKELIERIAQEANVPSGEAQRYFAAFEENLSVLQQLEEEGSAATPLKRFHALNLLAVLMINEKNDYGRATGLLQESLVLAQEVGIKPEVRHQVPRRPQGRHGPDQRPGRVLDHSEGRSSAGGPCGLRAHRRAGAHRGADRRPGVRDQQGGQPGGGSEAVGLREPRSRAALDRGGEERPVVREPPVRGRGYALHALG